MRLVRHFLNDFRSHVARSSAKVREHIRETRQFETEPKVDESDVPLRAYQHIFKFQVSVDNVLSMAVVEGSQEFPDDFPGHFLFHGNHYFPFSLLVVLENSVVKRVSLKELSDNVYFTLIFKSLFKL